MGKTLKDQLREIRSQILRSPETNVDKKPATIRLRQAGEARGSKPNSAKNKPAESGSPRQVEPSPPTAAHKKKIFKSPTPPTVSRQPYHSPYGAQPRPMTQTAGPLPPEQQITFGPLLAISSELEMRLRIDREAEYLELPQPLVPLHGDPLGQPKILRLGLDFGTSAIKAVIFDEGGRGRIFAVPFMSAEGIARYLLPARLYRDHDSFNLEGRGVALRNIKWPLIGENSPNEEEQSSAVAMLAFALQRAISWFWSTPHGRGQCADKNIRWHIAIGFPVEFTVQEGHRARYERLVEAAWAFVLQGSPSISVKDVVGLLRQPQKHGKLKVEVLPELAAQIYAFTVSDEFNPQRENNFLIADVGAGTVDASLFHVKKSSIDAISITLYFSSVSAAGVANLHRDRVDWLLEKIAAAPMPNDLVLQQMQSDLLALRDASDMPHGVPESFRDYLVDAFPSASASADADIDQSFMRDKAAKPARRSILEAVKKELLGQPRQVIQDHWRKNPIPTFICGGGAKMAYYRPGLLDGIRTQGATYLNPEFRQLRTPEDLEVVDVGDDFDRLSVAYGLSRMKLDSLTKVFQPPAISAVQMPGREDVFISKDMC